MVRKRKTQSETRSRVCEEDVDRISPLSDDLLVKILSFLPTKVAVSTSILSKRWECLWMWLPKLKFDFRYIEPKSLPCFLDFSMPLHRAPFIKSFHLNIDDSFFNPQDIKLWLVLALSRYLRKLKVTYLNSKIPSILPSSLYTCKSLVTLKLRGRIRLDVPSRGSLLSLKTLQLMLDEFLVGESLRRLLSICPVLEKLLVYCGLDNADKGLITVTVPSLKSLTLYLPSENEGVLRAGLVIDSPSLKYLKLIDRHQWSRPVFSIGTMPDLEEAYVYVRYCKMSTLGLMSPITSINHLMRLITSIKRLTICSEMCYTGGFVMNQLEHLKLCVCAGDSLNLLARLLEDSPNLRVLDIIEIDHAQILEEILTTARTVRESVLSNLQTFNWSRYFERRPKEMDLAVYILGEKWSLKDCNNNLV